MENKYQKQWGFLKNKFELGQLGHAYLLSGKNLELINNFAKQFIKLIICIYYKSDDRHICGISEKEEICQNCRMIEREAFPDLMVVKSENSESSLKNEKDMMNIEIEQIRDLQNFLSYKSYYGGHKTVIIENAERMTFEAQNCFLKNLEEPKGKTIIFLISSKPDLLLPTIFSRCQEIKFFQIGKYEFSSPEANPSLAEKEEQKTLQDLLAVAESDLATKFQYAKNANLEGENFNKILEILQRYLRNLLLFKIGVIRKIEGSNLNDYSVEKIAKAIRTIENISHQSNITNVNSKLALEIVLLEL